MGQSAIAMAFRKRAGKRGYFDIRIYKVYRNGQYVPGHWEVIAREPLSGQRIRVVLNETEMKQKFRRYEAVYPPGVTSSAE